MKASHKSTLVIGSINTAGQATSWSRAVREHTNATALSWQAEGVTGKSLLRFPVDEVIPTSDLSRSGFVRRLLRLNSVASHVLFESGRTHIVRGSKAATLFAAIVLRVLGKKPAIVFHGSDIRVPSIYRASHPGALFSDPSDPRTITLERTTRAMHAFLKRWPFPLFVSTPDLLRYLPGATWIPVIPEPEWFAPMAPIEPKRQKPRFLHLPSNRESNSSGEIEVVMHNLADEGLVEFHTLSGIPPAEVRQHVEWADVVIDKIGLGGYGVMAVQVMASGRLLIGDVDQIVRDAVPELPLIQSSTSTLEQVIRDLVADRSTWAARAAAGHAFARKYHDGRYSAAVLAKWMGVPVNQP